MEKAKVVICTKLQSNLNSTFGGWKKIEEDLDFFLNNNASQSKKSMHQKKPCSTTRIKSRKFLRNIFYKGVKKEDLFHKSFVFDVYVLTTKNIDPFSPERNIFDVKNREMIHTFWKQFSEPSFYRYIWKSDNFMYLNGKNVIYPRVANTLRRTRKFLLKF